MPVQCSAAPPPGGLFLTLTRYYIAQCSRTWNYPRTCGTVISDAAIVQAEKHFQANKITPGEVSTDAVLNVCLRYQCQFRDTQHLFCSLGPLPRHQQGLNIGGRECSVSSSINVPDNFDSSSIQRLSTPSPDLCPEHSVCWLRFHLGPCQH